MEVAVDAQNKQPSTENSDEEYMIPVNEAWPEGAAPVPVGSTPTSPAVVTSPSQESKDKSATLQSMTSNIYEDLMDSSTDEDGQCDRSTATTITERGDIFSDCLDETFENEDHAKGLPLAPLSDPSR